LLKFAPSTESLGLIARLAMKRLRQPSKRCIPNQPINPQSTPNQSINQGSPNHSINPSNVEDDVSVATIVNEHTTRIAEHEKIREEEEEFCPLFSTFVHFYHQVVVLLSLLSPLEEGHPVQISSRGRGE
jgi:hypothetical protein